MRLIQGRVTLASGPTGEMTLSHAERVGHPNEMKHEIVLSCKLAVAEVNDGAAKRH